MNRKLILSTATFAALTCMQCFAQPPERRGKQESKRGRAASTGQPDERAGMRTDKGPRGFAAQRDPSAFVARLMKQFDLDGDQKLDAKELTAALTAMRQRMQVGAGQPANPNGKSDASERRRRQQAKGARNRPGDKASSVGGDKPKRPGRDEGKPEQ